MALSRTHPLDNTTQFASGHLLDRTTAWSPNGPRLWRPRHGTSPASVVHAWLVRERPAEDLSVLRKAKDRLDRDYARPLDVESIARDLGMSAGHFSRRFSEEYGEPPYRYLMTRRVERATALLRTTERSVTEVCFAVGFSSLGTFSTRFSELIGVSPTAYRADPPPWVGGVAPCVAMRVTKPIRNREAANGGSTCVAGHGDHDPPELPPSPQP